MITRIVFALCLVLAAGSASLAQMEFEAPPAIQWPQLPDDFVLDGPAVPPELIGPDRFNQPDWFTGSEQWLIVPDETLQQKLQQLLELCAECYPKPEVFPFPIPKPRPGPGLGLPGFDIQGHAQPTTGRAHVLAPVRVAALGDAEASSALAAQITLARSITASQLCDAVLTRLLATAQTCAADASYKTDANEFVEVLSGGAPMPVFLIQLAAKSNRLAQHDTRAFESHRYYLAFILDLDLNMQVILFDYEPLYNLSGSIADVLNRNHFNTEYIEPRSNEGIVTLSDKLRTIILNVIVETAQNGATP